MIQVQLGEANYLAWLACDYCGHEVQQTGNVVGAFDPTTGQLTAGPFLTHAECLELFVASRPDIAWRSDELSRFMTKLIVKSQLDLGG
jgi:hypothetical protein